MHAALSTVHLARTSLATSAATCTVRAKAFLHLHSSMRSLRAWVYCLLRPTCQPGNPEPYRPVSRPCQGVMAALATWCAARCFSESTTSCHKSQIEPSSRRGFINMSQQHVRRFGVFRPILEPPHTNLQHCVMALLQAVFLRVIPVACKTMRLHARLKLEPDHTSNESQES